MHAILDVFLSITEFVFITVGLKMVVGHWIAEMLMKGARNIYDNTERSMAIWLHYQRRAAGLGHTSKSVLACHEDDCKVF